MGETKIKKKKADIKEYNFIYIKSKQTKQICAVKTQAIEYC